MSSSARTFASLVSCCALVTFLGFSQTACAPKRSVPVPEDVTEADAQKAGALFEELCPGAEVAVLPGGQPVYYYIISME